MERIGTNQLVALLQIWKLKSEGRAYGAQPIINSELLQMAIERLEELDSKVGNLEDQIEDLLMHAHEMP